MATKEPITINGVSTVGFNVCDTVGNGGKNRTDNGDVMLIQAMLHALANSDGVPAASRVGLTSMSQVPEPTGTFDAKTQHAILSYQRRWHQVLLRVDGVIHPASYQRRNILFGRPGERLMTITHFHHQLLSSTNLLPDYTIELTRKFPRLAPLLRPC